VKVTGGGKHSSILRCSHN